MTLPDLLDLDEPVVYSPPPNCCTCGKFVNVKTAHRHVEMGDYGTVYSVEFECASHATPDETRRQ